MEDSEFWSFIETIQGDGRSDDTTDLVPLVTALSRTSPEVIASFFDTLAQKAHALDTRSHYGAFSAIPGLADTFLYTRLSVIAQGEAVFKETLAMPERFPRRSGRWLEGLLYVADDAYATVTGQSFAREASVDIESFSNVSGWQD